MNTLVEQVYDAGIVGAGGAGFPTHVKMQGEIKTLIINAVECEPLLQVDKSLMTEYASELIEGLSFVMKELNVQEGIIGIKDKYQKIIDKLNIYAAKYPQITVKPLPNVYPVGDEVVLIKETTGITLKRGVLPITYNLMVINVETLLNVYKKVFAGQNVIHSYVTIIGEVENQGTYQLPIGMPLEDILNTLTKPLIENYKVVVGGPMTGKLAKGDEVVRKNTKAFIVLPYNHSLVRNMEDVNETHLKRIMASCSQCRACTDMCPRHLLGHQVEPHKLMNAMANGLKDNVSMLRTALGCVDCGVCELYACHHDLAPRKMMMAVKKAYALEGIRPTPEGCVEPHADRDYRRVPSKRLIMHLNLSKYDQYVPFVLDPIKPKRVRIPVAQHIGAPAISVVKLGDVVMENQTIANGKDGALSANIHASIDGKIKEITTHYIEIERA